MEFLAALPKAQRAYHAWLFRLGNASYRYQQQAAGEMAEYDFHHWLAGLPKKKRVVMKRDGSEASKNSLLLRQHAFERRDLAHRIPESHPLPPRLGLSAGISADTSTQT